MESYKKCYKCKEELPTTFFYKNKTKPDGLQGTCIKCSGSIAIDSFKREEGSLKRCCTCKLHLPIDNFGKSKNKPDGLSNRCILCERQKRQKAKNKKLGIVDVESVKTEKQCSGCKEVKNLSAFSINKSAKNGHKYQCKECDIKYVDKISATEKIIDFSEIFTCIICNEDKLVSEAVKSNGNPCGYREICKPCQAKRSKENYSSYTDEQIQIKRKGQLNRKLDIQVEIDKLKMQPCVDCGNKYEPFCMDFDHIGDDKFLGISQMVMSAFKIENIKEEILKTELVCVMCHKLRTYTRMVERYLITSDLIDGSKIVRKSKNKKLNYINGIKINTPCAICDEYFEPCQMEFDHYLGKKNASICDLVNGNAYMDELNEELKLVRLLCSMCHRRITIQQFEEKFGNKRIK